ncbi:electron transport complex subunit RsxC [Lacimicrobium sp. SS2-24]|uniref:electron transport complex subunit RsxC n=1 Tax=Lacimicrobium sp. SS2-24 TaxID=2005569 RepID=UPI001FEE295A|nr:electron transport complex subunit RsxC [Lacimicrobium sp. SS2-24]
MQSLIEKIRQGSFSDFPGGVYPQQFKELSNQTPISRIPLPEKLYIPVKQHIGVEGQIKVAVGDRVNKGQPLTQSMNPFAVPVHASTSGEITAIREHVSAHPSGLPETTIELTPDGEEHWVELTPMLDYRQHPKSEVLEAICRAGISGLGGAGFPTHIKVTPKKDIEFLIINGVECEPYISADDRLMREHSWQIRQGIDILCHLLNPKYVLIAIEDNKPEAIHAMQVACQENSDYIICSVPTKYPAGGEKQLIQVLTNREVPHNGLPVDVGVVMQNVATCYAVADAIFTGKPLIHRVVTLTGKALRNPGNVWALLGTPIAHLLAQADVDKQQQQKLIMGGPMMGFELVSDQIPVVKITNCLLAPGVKEMPDMGPEQPCIRCSACADACPAELLPQQLFWHAQAKELEKAKDYNLFDCIECGACAYVCPSKIPLVHYYRVAKAEIRTQEEEKQKADKARERFEARKLRLEQEKAEREARHKRASEARKAAMQEDDGGSQARIAATLARAKAKQEDNGAPSDNSDKVAAAIARAKARKAQASSSGNEVQPDANAGQDDKAAKVAAAVARAKAKKQSTQKTTTPEQPDAPEQDDKAAKVAAAVARAKAKKQSAQKTTTPEQPDAPEQDDKAAKVAAAVARAKAKKQSAQKTTTPEQPESPEQDDKAARVAAAVARAKAKKASRAQQQAHEESEQEVQPIAADSEKKRKVAEAIARAKAKKAMKDKNSS